MIVSCRQRNKHIEHMLPLALPMLPLQIRFSSSAFCNLLHTNIWKIPLELFFFLFFLFIHHTRTVYTVQKYRFSGGTSNLNHYQSFSWFYLCCMSAGQSGSQSEGQFCLWRKRQSFSVFFLNLQGTKDGFLLPCLSTQKKH